MDKQKKEQFKSIEKALIKEFKAVAKTFKYKSISNSLYKKDNDFFMHTVYFAAYKDNALKFTVWNYVKTYKSDNLFWTIFDMRDNISEKDSLRANGAYTMPSYKSSDYSLEIQEVTNLHEICKCFLLEQNGYLREDLIKMIANIELQNLKKAKEIAEIEIDKGNRGGFRNNDKDIYQYILEYCQSNA